MTCVECYTKNNFLYNWCCLHECGKHVICLNCENLNKNKNLKDCENKEKINESCNN